MNAVHVDWTLPKNRREDFELLTTVISALKWREYNGSIKMITDNGGAEFYRKNGLDILWDKGVSDELSGINADPKMFWAAGKIYALKPQKAPVAVMDTDFIVWKRLDFGAVKDAAVIHFEDINTDAYPDTSSFAMKKGYEFLEADSSVKACNTAFYVIKSQNLLDYYTKEAIRFIENAEEGGDSLTYMLYAEQRLFNICAEKIGAKVGAFSDSKTLFTDNEAFTHTWGMKRQMRENGELREKFCIRCAERIKKDFAYIVPVLKETETVGRYF